MILAKIRVNGVRAVSVDAQQIPKGIIGGQIAFEYTDPMWDGLTKTVVFQGAVTKDVVNAGDLVTIPPEVVQRAGISLHVGVYGTDAENNIAIPTLWADLGRIRAAADPSGDESTDESLPVWAQLQEQVDDLKKNGTGSVDESVIQGMVEDYLQENPPAAGKDGQDGEDGLDGEDGGHYTPVVTQPDSNTVQFAFTPSKADMPAVEPVQIPIPSSGGNVDLTGVVKSVNGVTPDENGNVEIAVSGGSGLTDDAKTLLIAILRNAVFTSDQSANITLLESALASGGDTGGDSGGDTDSYMVINSLSNVTNSNTASTVAANGSYVATLTANDGYHLNTVTVTMGGVDITETAWDAETSTITVSTVTGNLTITATASSQQSEVLEIVSATNYPNTTTFEWTEGSSVQYVVAKESTIPGGLLSIDYNVEECASFALNLYCFDADGNPYKYALIKNEGANSVSPSWGDPGTLTGFGSITAPCTVQIPEGCTFIGCMRRGGGTGSVVTSNDTFKTWAIDGGITLTVTG